MGFPASRVADLHIAPLDPSRPAGAQRFEDRLFGGPPSRVVLGGRLARAAVLDLPRREDALQKQLAMPLDHLSDPQHFDDIGSNSQHVHRHTRWQLARWPDLGAL